MYGANNVESDEYGYCEHACDIPSGEFWKFQVPVFELCDWVLHNEKYMNLLKNNLLFIIFANNVCIWKGVKHRED